MKKDELQELISQYKPKYIYQRYDGRLIKYEVLKDNYLVDTETGMSFDFRAHMMLGTLSNDKIDLIECGDLVIYKCININSDKLEVHIIQDDVDLEDYKNRFKDNFWDLFGFVTREKFNKIMIGEERC